MTWRHCDHERHHIHLALIILAEHCHINLLGDPAASIQMMRALPPKRREFESCRWRVELVNDSGKVISVSSQVVTNSAKRVLSDVVENVRLAGPSVDLLIGHKLDQCTSSIIPIDSKT